MRLPSGATDGRVVTTPSITAGISDAQIVTEAGEASGDSQGRNADVPQNKQNRKRHSENSRDVDHTHARSVQTRRQAATGRAEKYPVNTDMVIPEDNARNGSRKGQRRVMTEGTAETEVALIAGELCQLLI